jgi:zinc finger protein
LRDSYHGTCPACSGEIEIVHHRLEVPHFSDILLVSIACAGCGYRHVDTIILGEGEPVRWTMQVDDAEDLSTRVVRSTTGTIEVPELEMKVEPGSACEGFVTNIEGVLNRFTGAIDSFLLGTEDEEEREKVLAIRDRIEEAKTGSLPFTMIIEDPAGNSALISEKAIKTLLEIPET